MVLIIRNNFFVAVIQLSTLAVLTLLVQAHEDQSGFISIDCGTSDSSSYTDEATGINYLSDANFTESGENNVISKLYISRITSEEQLQNLRSFPDGMRNCYTFKPAKGKGTKYLIRARFLYGNYDNKGQVPSFDLYLGVDRWDTVKIDDESSNTTMEIIHVLSSDYLHVCLVNTGYGTPFISVLELRLIESDSYDTETGSLQLYRRIDYASASNEVMRYKGDAYDRFWLPDNNSNNWILLNTTLTDEKSIAKNSYAIPFTVMSNAYTSPAGGWGMSDTWTNLNIYSTYFFYMHFAEIAILKQNESRTFDVYVNDEEVCPDFTPSYLRTATLRNTKGTTPNSQNNISILLVATVSTLPPLINAIEIFELKQFSNLQTTQTDVEAILDVKSVYGLKRNWQGDPCSPIDYQWTGLNCSYSAKTWPRIVSLNLSSSNLSGEIAPSIANLTMLKILDLSNNNLKGTLPDFLAQLPYLKVLNLNGNNFSHPVPKAILTKNGWKLSLDANLMNCEQCGSHGNKSIVVPVVSSFGALLFLALISGFIYWRLKRRTRNHCSDARVETVYTEPEPDEESYGSKKQQFTYSEIQRITGNFNKVLGEGGFGKVYYGYLNGNEVAVKMLSSTSIQGHKQFHAELKLLLRVHHKNLTTLVGYCNEDTNIGLIYEYMAEGNLRSHISGKSQSILSWEARLRIAIDTAQGLEYLHNGCKPPIVHRDVKSTNILLTEKFQAKLGDFGLSKINPFEGGTQMTTTGITNSIAGTPGYLDPEYYVTNWLNEKSDVYSFGVVLLELITSRDVLGKSRENNHIIQWVGSMLTKGDIKTIVDPILGGEYDINTAWKAIEISMACVSKTSINRPSMSQVTTELKDCLMTELIRRNSHMANLSRDSSVEMSSTSITISEYGPTAR